MKHKSVAKLFGLLEDDSRVLFIQYDKVIEGHKLYRPRQFFKMFETGKDNPHHLDTLTCTLNFKGLFVGFLCMKEFDEKVKKINNY